MGKGEYDLGYGHIPFPFGLYPTHQVVSPNEAHGWSQVEVPPMFHESWGNKAYGLGNSEARSYFENIYCASIFFPFYDYVNRKYYPHTVDLSANRIHFHPQPCIESARVQRLLKLHEPPKHVWRGWFQVPKLGRTPHFAPDSLTFEASARHGSGGFTEEFRVFKFDGSGQLCGLDLAQIHIADNGDVAGRFVHINGPLLIDHRYITRQTGVAGPQDRSRFQDIAVSYAAVRSNDGQSTLNNGLPVFASTSEYVVAPSGQRQEVGPTQTYGSNPLTARAMLMPLVSLTVESLTDLAPLSPPPPFVEELQQAIPPDYGLFDNAHYLFNLINQG